MAEHGPFALEALRAGKHVFVEKPMAVTRSQAAELLETARAERPIPRLCTGGDPQPDLSGDGRQTPRRSDRQAGPRSCPIRMVGPRLERVVLPRVRWAAVRPRGLQPDQPHRPARSGARRAGDGWHRDTAPDRRRRAHRRHHIRQLPDPSRLRRRRVRRRDDRLLDAAISLTGAGDLWLRRHAADARRRLGARGLRAVGEQRRRVAGVRHVVAQDGRGPMDSAISSTASPTAPRR